MDSALSLYVQFSSQQTKAFGERIFWKCSICGAGGGDEPAIGKSASEMAEAHFDKVKKHYRAVGIISTPEQRKDGLTKMMREELLIFGRIGADDSSVIAAQIAHDYYSYPLKEKDQKIAELEAKLAAITG